MNDKNACAQQHWSGNTINSGLYLKKETCPQFQIFYKNFTAILAD